jgi:transposase
MTPARIDEDKRLYGEGKSVSDIAHLLAVSRPTIYRALEGKVLAQNHSS